MLSAADGQILLDVFHISLLALVVGLLTYYFIRSSNPLIRWHEHGNVWTAPFGFHELRIALLLIAMLYGLLYVTVQRIAVVDPGAVPVVEEAQEGSVGEQVAIILSGVVFHAFFAGAVLAYFGALRGFNLGEMFGLRRVLGLNLLARSLIGFAIGLLFAWAAAIVWGELLKHGFSEKAELQESVRMLAESDSWLLKGTVVFAAVIAAPISEEIIFRGFLYPALKRYSDRFFAAVVTSLIFAVIHFNTASVLPLFALAMVMVISYELSGSLLVPIGIHAIFNLFQTGMVFVFGLPASQ
ncbi:MAG: type II CAAX endopeptidase family protein [Verrucomicrobiota bacterium]